jgi:hypothetical protein
VQTSTVLYEPLPIGRLGIELENHYVVRAIDFSTFAYMLEEFITLGATKIIIPQSAPEIAQLPQMPELLRKHVQVTNDANERETIERLLSPIRAEFGVEIRGETHNFKFPDEMPFPLRLSISRIHGDLTRLALGFNHAIAVGIDPNESKNVLRELRKQLRTANSRALIAQIEAIFHVYEGITFDGPTPRVNAPNDLIYTFDKLVNDPSYLKFSEAVSELSQPQIRQRAFARVREYGSKFILNPLVSAGWNFTTKLINVWTGVPIPEASTMATVISSIYRNKSFPILVNLTPARQQAMEMWHASYNNTQPCNRSGFPYTTDEIYWLPPAKSIQPSHPDNQLLEVGTVGEIIEAFRDANRLLRLGIDLPDRI